MATQFEIETQGFVLGGDSDDDTMLETPDTTTTSASTVVVKEETVTKKLAKVRKSKNTTKLLSALDTEDLADCLR